MNQLINLPPVKWASAHPRLAAWIVLAAGMVVLLIIAAKDVGLLPGQWIALVVMTVLVAGACIWIISWEDQPDAAAETPAPETPAAPDTAASDEQETANGGAS